MTTVNIAENLKTVRAHIAKSASQREIGEDEVKLVAVTKNHGLESIQEAIRCGVTDIGENRVQEAREKFEVLGNRVRWHLIGHLQKNKAKYAVRMFDLIHSLDSEELADALQREASKLNKVQDVLVQVNLAQEPQKFGVAKDGLQALLAHVDSLENLRLRGLMCIAPNYENPEEARPLFRQMYALYQNVRRISWQRAQISYLSMGMTHDYRIAVAEGANIVRIGTAIFGPREY